MTENNIYATDANPLPPENQNAENREGAGAFLKSRRKKIILFAIIAAVIIITAVLIAFLIRGIDRKNIDYALIYSKNGDVILKTNSFEVNLQDDAEGTVQFSSDNKLMFYSTVSKKNENTFDLYCCKLDDKKSVESGGNIIASGISHDFSISADNKYLIYSQSSADRSTIYCYDLEKNSPQEISSGVEKVYMAHAATVFFIKTVDGKKVLIRYCAGATTEQLASNVKEARLFQNKETTELILESDMPDKPDNFSISKINSTGGIQKIADNVKFVNYIDYSTGNNLYYFKENTTNISWRNIVSDDNYEADLTLMIPNKEDYKISEITLLGITTYDWIGYNKALKAYDDKTQRDKMRAQIEKLVKDSNISFSKYSCYVYDGTNEKKVADDVAPENICIYKRNGNPRVIYKYEEYKQSDDLLLTIDSLVEGNEAYGGNPAEYAIKAIKNSRSEPELRISSSSDNNTSSIKLSGFKIDSTGFCFSDDGASLFSLVKDVQGEKNTLYINKLTQYGMSERESVDSNITQFSCTDEGVFYLKVDEGKQKGSIYMYNSSNSQKLSSKVSSFIDCGNDIIYLCSENEAGGSADAYIFSEGKNQLLTKNVSASDILYKDSQHVVYICNKAEGAQGEMYIYTGGGKSSHIDSGVTKIMNVVV